jgi:hypothetical protein
VDVAWIDIAVQNGEKENEQLIDGVWGGWEHVLSDL